MQCSSVRGAHWTKRGKALMRLRGELLERAFAHCLETGGMRRVHLRGVANILKRYLIHVAGFNLLDRPRRRKECGRLQPGRARSRVEA
jgi:hypothetical protein